MTVYYFADGESPATVVDRSAPGVSSEWRDSRLPPGDRVRDDSLLRDPTGLIIPRSSNRNSSMPTTR
jgi:hypothetical protein